MNREKIRKLLLRLMKMAGKTEPARRWKEVSLLLAGNAGIKEINRKLFGRDTETDVISQDYNPLPGEGALRTGEIVVNVERAEDHGRKKGHWTTSRELALYIAHACDHLEGANDSTRAGMLKMRRRELGWLRTVSSEGLTCGLLKNPAERKTRAVTGPNGRKGKR